MKSGIKIFITHASEDKTIVRILHQKFIEHGYKQWLDDIDLVPGQNWRIEIPKALKSCDLVILCLSRLSVQKKGYVQKEFRLALSAYAEKPPSTTYLLPLIFDESEIPNLAIPNLGNALSDIQWLDFWENASFKRLTDAISRAIDTSKSKQSTESLSDPNGAETVILKELYYLLTENGKLDSFATDRYLSDLYSDQRGFNVALNKFQKSGLIDLIDHDTENGRMGVAVSINENKSSEISSMVKKK